MTIDPDPSWSEAERWAWDRIQAGEVANFTDKLGETADPAKPEDWDDRRTLRRGFLEAIIEPPWREHVHRRGIRIIGALLPEVDGYSLDWERANVPWEVWLIRSRVTGTVKMRDAQIGGLLALAGSRFAAELDMERVKVEQDLFLHESAHFIGKLKLNGAAVGGQLAANGSHFDAAVEMVQMQVGKDLLISEGAHLGGNVRLRTTTVCGDLNVSGSCFKAQLDQQHVQVGRNLYLRGPAHFNGDVNVVAARVGGSLDATDAHFAAALNMQRLQVAEGVLLRQEAYFGGYVDLIEAKINGSLQLWGSTWIDKLDMTMAAVSGEFHLGNQETPKPPRWGEQASLVLRNARLGALQDILRNGIDSWPQRFDLSGCHIESLGGFAGGDDASDVLARPASYWVQWLARGTAERFSPQPYRMIAGLLREAGYPAKANTVLYAARLRERDQPRGVLHQAWLWFLWATIGFGIGRYFARVAGGWFLALATIGTAVLDFPTKAPLPTDNPLWKIAASVDRLIPFAELVPRLSETLHQTLYPWQTLYFAAHSLFGWVLAAMVVAGLAGLTQKA